MGTVFYAQTDRLRLATKLAANATPCAQYFVSVPRLAGDKTTLRSGQAWWIRALGPSFHALADVNFTAWYSRVTANSSTFYAARRPGAGWSPPATTSRSATAGC